MWVFLASGYQRRYASQAAWFSSCCSSSSQQCWSKCPWRKTASSLSPWLLSGLLTVSQCDCVCVSESLEESTCVLGKQSCVEHCVLCAAFGAVLQGSLFGLVGLLPQKYSAVFMSGQGLAGTFAAVAMLIAIGSKPPTGHT